jgi:hypothetical protein
MLNQPIVQPIAQPVAQPVQFGTALSDGGGGSSGPPVSDKLLTWLSGGNTSNVLKRDYKNGYDFTIQNCPPDYHLDALGNLELDALGGPEWDVELYEGWECEYLAPASGQPGHTVLLTNDNGELYTGTTPNVITKDFTNTEQVFFCQAAGKGLLVYEPLTPDELLEVQGWITPCIYTPEAPGNWLTANQIPLYLSTGEILTKG